MHKTPKLDPTVIEACNKYLPPAPPQKVFVLLWGGGDEPESPCITVHATRESASKQALQHLNELDLSTVQTAAALADLNNGGQWFDESGDTHLLITGCEVTA